MNIDRIVFGDAGYGFDCVARAADMNLRGGDTYIQETKDRICQKGFQAARAKQGNYGRLMWGMINDRHDGLCWKFTEKFRNLPVLLSKQLYADTARAATGLVVAGAGLRQPGYDMLENGKLKASAFELLENAVRATG